MMMMQQQGMKTPSPKMQSQTPPSQAPQPQAPEKEDPFAQFGTNMFRS